MNRNEAHTKEDRQRQFRDHYDEGISHLSCVCLAGIKRQAREGEVFVRVAPDVLCWSGEAESGLPECGKSDVIYLGSTFGFLWLVLSWKKGCTTEATGHHCPCPDCPGHGLQRCSLTSQVGCCRGGGWEFSRHAGSDLRSDSHPGITTMPFLVIMQ